MKPSIAPVNQHSTHYTSNRMESQDTRNQTSRVDPSVLSYTRVFKDFAPSAKRQSKQAHLSNRSRIISSSIDYYPESIQQIVQRIKDQHTFSKEIPHVKKAIMINQNSGNFSYHPEMSSQSPGVVATPDRDVTFDDNNRFSLQERIDKEDTGMHFSAEEKQRASTFYGKAMPAIKPSPFQEGFRTMDKAHIVESERKSTLKSRETFAPMESPTLVNPSPITLHRFDPAKDMTQQLNIQSEVSSRLASTGNPTPQESVSRAKESDKKDTQQTQQSLSKLTVKGRTGMEERELGQTSRSRTERSPVPFQYMKKGQNHLLTNQEADYGGTFGPPKSPMGEILSTGHTPDDAKKLAANKTLKTYMKVSGHRSNTLLNKHESDSVKLMNQTKISDQYPKLMDELNDSQAHIPAYVRFQNQDQALLRDDLKNLKATVFRQKYGSELQKPQQIQTKVEQGGPMPQDSTNFYELKYFLSEKQKRDVQTSIMHEFEALDKKKKQPPLNEKQMKVITAHISAGKIIPDTDHVDNSARAHKDFDQQYSNGNFIFENNTSESEGGSDCSSLVRDRSFKLKKNRDLMNIKEQFREDEEIECKKREAQIQKFQRENKYGHPIQSLNLLKLEPHHESITQLLDNPWTQFSQSKYYWKKLQYMREGRGYRNYMRKTIKDFNRTREKYESLYSSSNSPERFRQSADKASVVQLDAVGAVDIQKIKPPPPNPFKARHQSVQVHQARQRREREQERRTTKPSQTSLRDKFGKRLTSETKVFEDLVLGNTGEDYQSINQSRNAQSRRIAPVKKSSLMNTYHATLNPQTTEGSVRQSSKEAQSIEVWTAAPSRTQSTRTKFGRKALRTDNSSMHSSKRSRPPASKQEQLRLPQLDGRFEQSLQKLMKDEAEIKAMREKIRSNRLQIEKLAQQTIMTDA